MKQANQANERQFRGLFWFYRTANSGMARNSLQGKLLNPLLEGVSMIERQTLATPTKLQSLLFQPFPNHAVDDRDLVLIQ